LDDHRRTGLGRLEGAEAYIAAAAALFDQAPDLTIEVRHVVALAAHGVLSMAHAFGTLVEGGPFELVYLWLARFENGRLVGTETFEPEDLDRSLARFEELRTSQGG